MNRRTASDNRSKLPINSTATEVARQLAFIDNVCSLLIESRFGRKYYSPFNELTPAAEDEKSSEWMPLHEFTRPSRCSDIDPILAFKFIPPRTARPAAPSKRSSSPATSYSSTGIRAVLERIGEILETHFERFFHTSAQPRGSPQRSSLFPFHFWPLTFLTGYLKILGRTTSQYRLR